MNAGPGIALATARRQDAASRPSSACASLRVSGTSPAPWKGRHAARKTYPRLRAMRRQCGGSGRLLRRLAPCERSPVASASSGAVVQAADPVPSPGRVSAFPSPGEGTGSAAWPARNAAARSAGCSASQAVRGPTGIIDGQSTRTPPPHDRPRQAHPARHQRVAVRQRRAAPRAHRRVRPDRHLGAVPAHARPRLPVHLGERRARHADHAQGAAGRHHARAADRAHRRRAAPRLRRVRHLVRQLPHHALGREPRGHLRDLSPAGRGRPHPARDDRAGLRRAGEDVPARPLRARHVPEVRRARPVRRQLRGLRRHLHARRPAATPSRS